MRTLFLCYQNVELLTDSYMLINLFAKNDLVPKKLNCLSCERTKMNPKTKLVEPLEAFIHSTVKPIELWDYQIRTKWSNEKYSLWFILFVKECHVDKKCFGEHPFSNYAKRGRGSWLSNGLIWCKREERGSKAGWFFA